MKCFLSINNSIQRDQLEMVTLDRLVPQDHLVRKMEAALDFSFIYDLFKMCIFGKRRPSIDPVILIELTFERVFADAKEKHGMRWTNLRGLKNCPCRRCLLSATLNLKKLAYWTWNGPVRA